METQHYGRMLLPQERLVSTDASRFNNTIRYLVILCEIENGGIDNNICFSILLQIQEWIRTIVANRIGVDGKSWSDFFSMHNSGTYNNQWMVVDYKLFKRNQSIK